MSAFLVDGKMITAKGGIRGMWADHFEALGTPLAGMGLMTTSAPESPSVLKKCLKLIVLIVKRTSCIRRSSLGVFQIEAGGFRCPQRL